MDVNHSKAKHQKPFNGGEISQKHESNKTNGGGIQNATWGVPSRSHGNNFRPPWESPGFQSSLF